MCTVFRSLLADEAGVYEPRDSNDRLLLGLKVTISEYELVLMATRLLGNRLRKAKRGELFQNMPTGYFKCSSSRVELDPDEQVRSVIRLIFDKYDELGSVGKVFRYLLWNKILLGFRPFRGPKRGPLEWRRPTLGTVFQILRHPIYAGAYAYGRQRRKDVGASAAMSERTSADKGDPIRKWRVLKLDHLPAYITWDRYIANQQRMRQNRCLPDTVGPAHRGTPCSAAW